MSKKGGSSGSSQTTTSSSQPPQQVLDAYNALIQRATGVANTPYQPYSGQTVAGLTDTQNQGIQGITNAQGIAQPYLNQAATYANNSAQNVMSGVPQYSQSALQQYYSPYQQDVVNATQANINQSNAVQQQQLLGNAIQSGASPFGGDRAGVAAAELARNQNLASQQTIAGLENQGFQQAQGQFNTQQQLQLQGNTANAQLQGNAANLLGNLGLGAQSSALQGSEAQLEAGTLQQQTNQAGLTSAYNQWMQQQAFPYQQTQWLGNLTEGIGSQEGGTSSTTTPGPSTASQAAGFGTFLGGLSGFFQKGGRVPHFDSGGTPYDDGVSWISSQPLTVGHTIPNAPKASSPDNSNLTGFSNMMSSMGKGNSGGLGNLWDSFKGTQFGNSLGSGMFSPSIEGMPWLEGGAAGGEALAGAGEAGAAAGGTDMLADLGMAAMFAKRGGGIPHYDDGGNVDEDETDNIFAPQMAAFDPNMDTFGNTYRSASEPISGLGATQAAAMDTPTLPTTPITGSDDITAHNNPGLAVANANPQVETNKPSLSQAMMVAGLGMMAGNSPNAVQNIAKGGLEGFSNYAQQKQAIVAQQKEQQLEKHQQDMDAKPSVVSSGTELQMFYPQEIDPKTGKKGLMVPLGIPTEAYTALQASLPMKQAQMDYLNAKAKNAEKGPNAGTTGALIDKIMAENPGMNAMDALAYIKGGAHNGIITTNGVAAPVEGYGKSKGDIAHDTEAGKQKAEVESAKDKEEQKTLGKQAGENAQTAIGTKDVVGLYGKIQDDAKTTPSGFLESSTAKLANLANVPTDKSIAQARFDADLNNLYLGTIRSLKGTGRIMEAELNQIQQAAPKDTDSNAVKIEKAKTHMDYYRNRMKEFGFDPDTGSKIGTVPGGKAPPSVDDINFTAEKYHMTPQQVRAKLGM